MKADLGDDAAFYAGGTELLLVMKLGLAEYGSLIDLKRVPELRRVKVSEGSISIGAAVTHREVETHPGLHQALPEIGEMASRIGNARVRNSGTIGGNLAFADPHSDPATFLTALGGSVLVAGTDGGTRRVAVEDFALGPYTTALDEGEVLVSVDFPIPLPGSKVVHRHLRFRERPTITITVAVDPENRTAVSVGSVVPAPIRLADVEAMLRDGETVSHDELRVAASASIDPVDDMNGSAEYKRHLASEMVARAVLTAFADESEGGPWNL